MGAERNVIKTPYYSPWFSARNCDFSKKGKKYTSSGPRAEWGKFHLHSNHYALPSTYARTCVASRVCHMEEATSGEREKAASVSRISALSELGTGQPTRPNREATGSHVWLSYMTILAASSCTGVRGHTVSPQQWLVYNEIT